MPPYNNKKKNSKKTNKKKKHHQTAPTNAHPPSTRQTANDNNNKKDPFQTLGSTQLPSFHKEDTANVVVGGYYPRYKQATTRFCEWMKRQLGPMGRRFRAVNDLRKGADWVLEQTIHHSMVAVDANHHNDNDKNNHDRASHNHTQHYHNTTIVVAPKDILDDLDTSIRYRQLLTAERYPGTQGDRGHEYMIGILKHCRSVLSVARRMARSAALAHRQRQVQEEDKNQNELDGIGGRFQALLLEENDDQPEEEEDEEELETLEQDIRKGNMPTPPIEPPEQDLDIEEHLIQGSDKFQAMSLLRTMEYMMDLVDGHYQLLKDLLRGHSNNKDKDNITYKESEMYLLMDVTAVTNFAIETVRVEENLLATNHPHLSTFYHVLALVFFSHSVAALEQEQPQPQTQNKTTNNSKDTHHVRVLNFVAEIVECAFHNRGADRVSGKVQRFVRQTGLPHAAVQRIARVVFQAMAYENMLAFEVGNNTLLIQDLQQAGASPPHSWFGPSPHIGQDRCILNTQKIVQMVLDIVEPNKKLIGRPGFWGIEFDELRRPATGIRGDLDETLAGKILPELIAIAWAAPWHQLPEVPQLLPVLHMLHQQVRTRGQDCTAPVPVALTFGLHAMLTAILVIQGNGDLARLASYTKQSYNKLFSQLQRIQEDPSKSSSSSSPGTQNAPTFYANVQLFGNVVHFAQPVSATNYDARLAFLDPSETERLAFWNPVVGGEYLLYGTYMCSIALGSATIDSLGQLRMTLHLYHAMKSQLSSSQMDELKIPFLENLDQVFSKTKAIWVAGRALEKGSFSKQFWMAWGMSSTQASQQASSVLGGDEQEPFAASLQRRAQMNSRLPDQGLRTLEEIKPEDFCSSYRRLVLRDWTPDDTLDGEDDVVAYSVSHKTSKEERKNLASTEQIIVQINTLRDSMDEDEDYVLPINFPVVSGILLEFLHVLGEGMGWNRIISQALQEAPDEVRMGRTMGGRKMKPGGFLASDLNFTMQGLSHFVGMFLATLDQPDGDGGGDMVERIAGIMKEFFGSLPKDRFSFFVDSSTEPPRRGEVRRNPLEGTYHSMRSGRSMQYPLQAFMHLKYSKKRKAVARLIKPGKYTPYLPSEDGDYAESPYVEEGSKLPREPTTGKFRHIASYSMDELMDLGWDGAMYVSSQGQRHGLSGRYVPFIVGYDSDSGDEYEPINVRAGERAGIIGLPRSEVGSYMAVPDFGSRSCKMVKLNSGH